MRRSSADGVVAALVGVAILALFVTTLAPGLANDGGDGHELTIVAATLGLAHPTGYPLYTWVGHLFTRLPIGEVAYRTNLMSAVLGAAGCAMLLLVARRLGLRRGVAVWTAALFGLSTTFWSQAVITEVYAPNLFMVTLTLWLALRWADATRAPASTDAPRAPDAVAIADRRFVVFALVYGLSFGAHMSNLGFAPFYALFVLLIDPRLLTRRRTVLLGVLAFAAGLAQFAWLPLKARGEDIFPNTPPDTVPAFLAYTVRAFTELRFAFPLSALPSRVVGYVAFLIDNFTPVGTVLGFAGMWVALRRDVARFHLLFGMWAVHVVVFSQMFVPDPDVFFIASNALFALFAGFGADALVAATARGAAAARRRPSVAVVVLVLVATVAAIARASHRDNDRSTDTSLADFHQNVFAHLPAGSLLIPKGRGLFGSDVTYWRRIRHVRPDVVASTDRDAKVPPGAPAFVDRTTAPAGLRVPPGALVPVIRGYEPDQILYRVETATWDPTAPAPATDVPEQDLGVATLVAMQSRPSIDGGVRRVHVRALWRPADCRARTVVSTNVDDVMLESHLLAAGAPVVEACAAGRVVVDEYDAVVPSTLTLGRHELRLGAVELGVSSVTIRTATPVAFDVR